MLYLSYALSYSRLRAKLETKNMSGGERVKSRLFVQAFRVIIFKKALNSTDTWAIWL